MSAPEPDLEIQAAARLLADGNPGDAARMLERLVTAAPVYAAGLVLLARAYDEEGRPDDALDAWHRAHFLVPTSPLVRRERQRLLDSRAQAAATSPPGGPPPLPSAPDVDEEDLLAEALLAEAAAAPSDPIVPDEPRPEPEDTLPVAAEEPFDALWADEPDVEDVLDVQWVDDDEPTEAEAPAISDAPSPIEEQRDINATAGGTSVDAFEWSLSPPEERPSILVTPDTGAVDPPRLFSEEAFAAETAFGAETVFGRTAPLPHEEDPDSGWTLLDETTEPARSTPEPQEADIAPPLGFDRSFWGVVPTERPADEAHDGESSPAAEQEPDVDAAPAQDDLDSLIEQLETAPRIRPDPHFVDPGSAGDLPGEDEEVVSETLARIYAAQAQFSEAAGVYEKLAVQRPDRADEFRQRAAEMRGRAGDE